MVPYIFLIACIISFNAQAMQEPQKRILANTYLAECKRDDIKREGFCSQVSGNGITITAYDRGPVIKLTMNIRKLTDTSNNPAFKAIKIESLNYSFVGLRAAMKDYPRPKYPEDNIVSGISCQEHMSNYLERSSGRGQFSSDLECTTYVSKKKLYRWNARRTRRNDVTADYNNADDDLRED